MFLYGIKLHHHQWFHRFPSGGSLDLVAVDILGVLPESKSKNKLVVVSTNCYGEWSLAVRTSTITLTHATNIFLTYSILLYIITETVTFNDGEQFVTKNFSLRLAHRLW